MPWACSVQGRVAVGPWLCYRLPAEAQGRRCWMLAHAWEAEVVQLCVSVCCYVLRPVDH